MWMDVWVMIDSIDRASREEGSVGGFVALLGGTSMEVLLGYAL